MFAGVVWVSVGVTAMTASVTQAAFMAPANSPGNVTARRDGVDSSATRVSSLKQLILCWVNWSSFYFTCELSCYRK